VALSISLSYHGTFAPATFVGPEAVSKVRGDESVQPGTTSPKSSAVSLARLDIAGRMASLLVWLGTYSATESPIGCYVWVGETVHLDYIFALALPLAPLVGLGHCGPRIADAGAVLD
jgi:hypothetical protein